MKTFHIKTIQQKSQIQKKSQKFNKRNRIHSILTCQLCIVALFVALPVAESENDTPQQITKLQTAISYIERNSLTEHSTDELVTAAISGMLSGLDPYSHYDPPVAYARHAVLDAATQSWSTGITTWVVDNRLVVWSIDKGSPAFDAVVLPEDRFDEIQGRDATTLTSDEADALLNPLVDASSMTGAHDSIRFRVFRPSTGDELSYALMPRPRSASLPTIFTMLDDSTGYVRFDEFASTTSEAVFSDLTNLKYAGARRFILDLRYNGGGLVRTALEIGDALIGRGDELLSVDERDRERKNVYYGKESDILCGAPLIVLVGKYTASAAELLAGMLQDEDRAAIVGLPTYGKGLVQHVSPLGDGSGITLVTGKMHLPCGRAIQRTYKGGRYSYTAKAFTSEIDNFDHTNDTLFLPAEGPYHTRTGRKIYGGEGIIPDYIVNKLPTTALGTSGNFHWLLNKAADRYLDHHAEAIAKLHPSIASMDSIAIPNSILDGILRMATDVDVKVDAKEAESDLTQIKSELRDKMGARMFGEAAWTPQSVKHDRQIKFSLSLFPRAQSLASKMNSDWVFGYGKQ